eukprot:SAG11_NODE_680_length_7781_cov_6.490497_1_plen_83_part_00
MNPLGSRELLLIVLLCLSHAHIAEADCMIPRGNATRELKCEYIKANEDACELEGAIDYLSLYYCTSISQAAAYLLIVGYLLW